MSEFTRDEALAHFGVKGMKWGVRKQNSSGSGGSNQGMSTKKKVLIGATVVVGVAASAAVLYKTGKIPTAALKTTVEGFPKSYSPMIKGRPVMIKGTPKMVKPVRSLSDQLRDYEMMTPRMTSAMRGEAAKAAKTTAKGKSAMTQTKAFTEMRDTMLKDIADAHAEQTAWMKKMAPGVNVRDNPFLPPSEIVRLSHSDGEEVA